MVGLANSDIWLSVNGTLNTNQVVSLSFSNFVDWSWAGVSSASSENNVTTRYLLDYPAASLNISLGAN